MLQIYRMTLKKSFYLAHKICVFIHKLNNEYGISWQVIINMLLLCFSFINSMLFSSELEFIDTWDIAEDILPLSK